MGAKSTKSRASRNYEDFVIGAPSRFFYFLRPFVWAWARLGKTDSTRYYGTSIRRVGTSKVEVTFDLPPTVKERMQRAVAAGKQIRLFVL